MPNYCKFVDQVVELKVGPTFNPNILLQYLVELYVGLKNGSLEREIGSYTFSYL